MTAEKEMHGNYHGETCDELLIAEADNDLFENESSTSCQSPGQLDDEAQLLLFLLKSLPRSKKTGEIDEHEQARKDKGQ